MTIPTILTLQTTLLVRLLTVNSESKEPGISKEKKEIVLNSDNFYQTIVKVGSNAEQYKDYTVYMTGYVNREDNTLKSNEFTISRMAMACCIADVAPNRHDCIQNRWRQLAKLNNGYLSKAKYLLETSTVVNNHM